MAVYSGPKVVTDGIVLHLDKYNEENDIPHGYLKQNKDKK